MVDEVGGIDVENAVVLDRNSKVLDDDHLIPLRCNYCNKLLRDAYQLLGCGHRFCKVCLLKKVFIGREPVCSVDKEVISDEDVKPDKACHKEFLKMKAQCQGCKWEGPLLELEEHFLQCLFIDVYCDLGCGNKVIRKDLSDHYVVCPYRNVECKFCNNAIHFYLMEDHIRLKCNLAPVTCDKCNKDIPKAELQNHQSTTCPENEVKCAFSDCPYQDKLIKMREHYKVHMFDMIRLLGFCEKTIKVLQSDKARVQNSLTELEEKALHYQHQIGTMQNRAEEVSLLDNAVKQLKIEVAEAKTRFSQAQFDSGGVLNIDDDELRMIGSRIVKLEQEVMVVKPSIEEVQQTMSGFKSQIVGYVETVRSIRETVSRHTVAMDEVKLRQDLLDVKTVNGIFVWKIPEVARRYREAQEKRTLSLYSPPFQTSPHGYRMCIRAYLNGDGSGKGTCVSVFFVLMKSEHDELLSWPFRRPVTFELVNQNNRAKGIIETFMPDTHSPSFQKPQSEMNVASGFPKFAKQLVLKDPNFARDDSIFIRCKVDTAGLLCE